MLSKTEKNRKSFPVDKGGGTVVTLSAIVAASVACFFVFQFLINPSCAYDAQQPVFFITTGFFAGFLTVPGGLSDYCGLLLSQTWHYSPLGSIISAFVIFLILCGMGILLKIISKRYRPFLSLLPALPLLCMHCSYYHPMKIDVIVLLALVSATIYSALYSVPLVRRFFYWGLVFFTLFYLAGSIGLALFVLFSVNLELCRMGKKGVFGAVVYVFAGSALLWLSYWLVMVPGPVRDLISFFAMPQVFQVPPVLLAASISFTPQIALARIRNARPTSFLTKGFLRFAAAFVLLLFIGAAGVAFCLDEKGRRHFSYDQMACEGRWQDLLRDALNHNSGQNPVVYDEAFYMIRALYHTGKLFDELVASHPSSAINDLALPSSDDGETTVANGDLYFEMGGTNLAIRYAFEAIAIYGYSPRLLQRLALCYAAQGKTEIARSMTAMLENTIVGGAWARSFAALLDDPAALARHDDVSRLRLLQPKADFFTLGTILPYEFRHIWAGGATFNKMAMEYYLASAPQLLGEYLDFIVLASRCYAGDALSCDSCTSAFGQTFWYQHFIRSPELFPVVLASHPGGGAKP